MNLKTRIPLSYVSVDDLPCWYAIASEDATTRSIALSSIVPTQPYVLQRIVQTYVAKHRLVDADGMLPFGLRFAGSRTVYLVDGHHRLVAARMKGRKRLRLIVDDYPYTFAEALRLVLHEPEYVPA